MLRVCMNPERMNFYEFKAFTTVPWWSCNLLGKIFLLDFIKFWNHWNICNQKTRPQCFKKQSNYVFEKESGEKYDGSQLTESMINTVNPLCMYA